MKKFSENLADYRKENSLTKHEMAAILGISDRMYIYYENGDFDGKPEKVAKYLHKLSSNNRKYLSHAGQEIADLLEKDGYTLEKAADKMGVTINFLNNQLQKTELDTAFIKLLVEKLNYGLDYHPIISQLKNIVNESEFGYGQNNVVKNLGKKVPVYDIEATAGNIELFNNSELIKGYIDLPSFSDCIGFLYVRGDSMYPTFKAGDLIGVIPVNDMDIIQFGHAYLVITVDNQRLLKNIRKGKSDEELILRSKNQDYDDINIQKSKITKLYRVKGPIRDDWQ